MAQQTFVCQTFALLLLLGLSVLSDFLWPHELHRHTTQGIHVLGFHLLDFVQTHVHWISDAIQRSHPLSSPPALNLSQHQGLFQWISSLHQVAKILELQLQHQSFQWYAGLISFRVDLMFKELASLLYHHNSKASVLQCSAFIMVQLSHTWLMEKP